MTENANDSAMLLAAGTLSVDYLNSLSPGYAGPGARYAVTPQVQWVTFDSGLELERAIAVANPITSMPTDAAGSTRRSGTNREAIVAAQRVAEKPIAGRESVELSEREKACLTWVARGKSSWETGQILSISENTVNFHVKNSMRKLGVGSRALAAVKTIQLGLITSGIGDESATSPRPTGRKLR